MAGRLLPYVLAGALWPAVLISETGKLSARFIGSAAVGITDGEFTLLTDFPYQSGAFGYMTYDPAEVAPRGKSVCLFTHAHADHFEPSLVGKIGCTVVGPSNVESKLVGVKTVALSVRVSLPPLTIKAVRTEHGPEEHDSYLVRWNGLSLYFTGDTDSPTELSKQEPLDVLFITPWLLAKARATGSLPTARKIIIIHHRSGERIGGCSSCLIPSSGQTFELSR